MADLSTFFMSGPNWDPQDRTDATFTGVDMRVVFGTREIGTVSALSVTITRDVVPRYSSGRTGPRAFARGRRGIAGTMTFQVFDRDPLLRDLYRKEYYSTLQKTVWENLQYGRPQGSGGTGPGQLDSAVYQLLNNMRTKVGSQLIKYADQLPATDVTISFVNDMGQVSVARLIGVVFLSVGMAWSMGDVETEQATTYLAKDFQALTPVWDNDPTNLAAQNMFGMVGPVQPWNGN